MAGTGSAIAVIFAFIAVTLFALALTVNQGYLGSGGMFEGQTPANYSVYGVLSAIAALGGYEWEKRSYR